MAMRETKSSTNNPSDSWAQFYSPPNISGSTPTPTMFTISDAATTTTTTTPTAAATAATSSHQLSSEGRVSKPIRRRSRASRRTPTTLLNTDPTNFRAMVQQFTGGSSGGSGFTEPCIRAASSLQFGQQILPKPNNTVVFPTGAYYHQLHLQQQQRQQQQQQQHTHALHQYEQRPYVFSHLMNNIGGQDGGFDIGTEGIAISTHAPPPSAQNRNSNGSNNGMF